MQQVQELLTSLPPFQGREDYVVHGDQKASQILDQILKAHIRYEPDYDRIAPKFRGGNVLRKLFDFCLNDLDYKSESGKKQTTRSPAAMIVTNDFRGVDCKHYSGFIAGVLDALNRTGAYNFDWTYRFAEYGPENQKRPQPDHVFVVVRNPDGSEIWLDPAPIYDKDTDEKFSRYFNDREILPTHIYDRKPEQMSITDISGPRKGTIGCADNCQDYTGGRVGQLAGSIPGVTEAQDLADTIASALPPGGLRDFLKTFLKDPVGAVRTLIFGRTYTSGAYALGEIYMRNILGYSQIQSRQDVPDSVIVQAETFFTTALGVLIGSGDHLNQLIISPQSYLDWSPDFKQFTLDQVTRAHNVLKAIGYPFPDAMRNSTYPLPVFASIPYIYPLPTYCLQNCNPVPLFTGAHPITGQSFQNGYPVGYNTTSGGTGSGTGTGTGSGSGGNPPAPPQQAGLSLAGKVLIGGMAAGLLYAAFSGKPAKSKRKRRR